MRYPENTDDVIDSRDVIAALLDLAQLHQAGAVFLDGELHNVDANDLAQDQLFSYEAKLLVLGDEASHYAEDWGDGATLIRDSYFEEYAHELADDLDLLPRNRQWPMTCIDWEQAARELRMDYTAVDFDGVTYWVR